VDAGVCGFHSQIAAESEDEQHVDFEISSTCPHIEEAAKELGRVDAFVEVFCKPHETETYTIMSKHIPHVACPVHAGVLKAIEAAAHLALPRDASITFVGE
jgi:hypothetical protein